MSGRRPLLLTGSFSSEIPPSTGHEAPRVDFVEIARQVGGDILMPRSAGRLGHRLDERIPSSRFWRQAFDARGRRPAALLSLSEKVAFPALALNPRLPHMAVGHNLTTPRRRAFQRYSHWLNRVDRIVVRCTSQARYLLEEVGLPRERVHVVSGKVDHRFFRSEGADPEGYVLAVGQARRDYTTFLEAVESLSTRVVMVPSSRWAELEDAPSRVLPPNVVLRTGLSDVELRETYDRSSLVVVPLQVGVDTAAGVTAVLEGMAMSKPVVVSEVPGIADYVRDGDTARLVPAADPEALRKVMVESLSNPEEAAGLGLAGRAFVESGCNLDTYVAGICRIVSAMLPWP